ncbi:MAG TPA: hypothetical protein VFR99_06040 [Marmoricola sp.]|nr:hypothetical protein [Marmoricola sp.]
MSKPKADLGAPGVRRVFGPTTGLVTGWLGVAIVVVVVVLVLAQEHSLLGARVVLGALACGLVLWCYLLRPRVVLEADRLELRNAFSTLLVPWLLVGDVLVRTVTRVYVGDKVYVGTAVGHTARSMMRTARKQRRTLVAEPHESTHAVDQPLPTLIEEAIRERARSSQRAAPAEAGRGEVTREWAVPELAVLVALLVGFAVTFAL